MAEVPIIDQTISAVAPVLHRDTINPTNPATQDAFVQSAEAFFDKISDTTVNEINQVTTKIDTTVSAINVVAQEISEAATIAIASGQYKGDWVAGFETTGYSLGDGVTFSDGYNYVSKINNNLTTPITLTNTDQWNFIEAVNPNNYYLKTETDNLYVPVIGDKTIDGKKTFTSSPIVPTPTTDFQSVPLKSTNITVNVGDGQIYTTINQALEYLSGFYPMYKKSGVTATINLKAGFVMAEQVLVSGIDLGWITIVGEDAETIITHTALTDALNGTYPAFGVNKGGTSPVIGQLFRFNVEKVGGEKHGLITLGAGSSANVLSGKGFIGAGANGIYAYSGSTINAEGAKCSNAGSIGISAVAGSTINAQGANCSNAGSIGVYAANGSTINAQSVIIQNQTTANARVRVDGGSHIVAKDIIVTGGTAPAFSQAVNTVTIQGVIYG